VTINQLAASPPGPHGVRARNSDKHAPAEVLRRNRRLTSRKYISISGLPVNLRSLFCGILRAGRFLMSVIASEETKYILKAHYTRLDSANLRECVHSRSVTS
jgi:hypothetical protein